jgi:phosphoenolpyruvate---glycerone phosphotransferase subunit DhaK
MNRVINNPEEVVEDAVTGLLAAHPDLLAATDNPRVIRAVHAPRPGKVGIVTGGGSGHEPAFVGYVGPGLIDAVALGEVFASPSARSFHHAFKAADGGAGIACLYGNYAGDNMNVKMAVKLAEREGLVVKTVVANDDVASAPPEEAGKRRGVAGEILTWKVGAARAAIDATRSIGIGLSACTIPAAGKPNFSIREGHMEVGIGHHGEPGVAVMPTKPAREMAELMMDAVLADLPFDGADVAVLISGLGATPLMELYILYGHVAEILAAHKITPRYRFVGNYFTSLDMMGVSVTLMRLDGELDRLIGAPARAIGLTVGGKA